MARGLTVVGLALTLAVGALTFLLTFLLGDRWGMPKVDQWGMPKVDQWGLCLFTPVTFGASALVGSLLWHDLGLPRQRWMKAATATKNHWLCMGNAVFYPGMDVKQQLLEAEPEMERMKKWLSSPDAVQALRKLRQSPVPITRRDAIELDRLCFISQHRHEEQSRASRAIEWQHALDELGSPAP
jgi:hypothetical protein